MTIELEGRLHTFTLSDILQLLSISAQTGTLHLIQGWNERTITFEMGRLTYLAAATRLPTIGELLVRSGKITQDQLDDTTVQANGQPVGPLLIALGLATQDDLNRTRDVQLEETIYSLFLWRDCQFKFDGDEIVHENGIPVDFGAERLIMNGTRRVDEWISISPVVPSVRMTFRKLPAAEAPNAGADLDDREKAILEHVGGQSDVVALARAAGQTQFETARVLAKLVRAGLVRVQPPNKVKIIELFKDLVESIYVKLTLYGYARQAFEFEREMTRFSLQHGLKTRMRGGKVILSDLDLPVESTVLIDLYKLFIAIELNRFSKLFEPDVVRGLVEGLYLHVDEERQELLRLYEFHQIEGLLRA